MLVLVAEDEALIAMTLTDCLARAGHEVMGPAVNSASALRLAEARQPDLALLDINLSDGVTGTDLARALKSRWAIPVIFLTGQPSKARAAADSALGMLTKPYLPQDVIGCVDLVRRFLAGEGIGIAPRALELFPQSAPVAATIGIAASRPDF